MVGDVACGQRTTAPWMCVEASAEERSISRIGDLVQLKCLCARCTVHWVHGALSSLLSTRGRWRKSVSAGCRASARCFVRLRAARRAHRGCAPPAEVRVQLPQPAAGHPWPAGSTPPRCTPRAQAFAGSARKSTVVVQASPAADTPASCVRQFRLEVGRCDMASTPVAAAMAAMAVEAAGRKSPPRRLWFFAAELFRKRDDGSKHAADAGGCPEPAMDGRRPDVGAGRGDIRLGIPLWPRRAARAAATRAPAPAPAPGRRLARRLRACWLKAPLSDGTPSTGIGTKKKTAPERGLFIWSRPPVRADARAPPRRAPWAAGPAW